MLPLEVTSYIETDDVPATNSLTKIMEEAKIWFLSPGGDFVTIQGLSIFCFCKQISCSNCMIVYYTDSYSCIGRKA